MNIFKQDNTMKRIMKNTKYIKGKRQLPNLRRILMKSDFNENNTQPCVSKCNEPRCGLCKTIIKRSCLKLNDKTFHAKENMNCTVRNVFYVLICNGCVASMFPIMECNKNNFNSDYELDDNWFIHLLQ